MKNKKECRQCGKWFTPKHLNKKYCKSCDSLYQTCVRSAFNNSTPEQRQFIKFASNKMTKAECAKQLNMSVVKLKRVASAMGIKFTFSKGFAVRKYNRWLTKEIVAYYEKHGKLSTQKKYPGVKLRSVIERNKHKPRQTRWKTNQKIYLIRTAGLVSFKKQAEFLNRPNAYEGSIQQFWLKKYNTSSCRLNGLTENTAKLFVTDDCPYIQGDVGKSEYRPGYKIHLWVDMEKHIRPDCPSFIVKTIKMMANFQRWIWQVKNPKELILKMLNKKLRKDN